MPGEGMRVQPGAALERFVELVQADGTDPVVGNVERPAEVGHGRIVEGLTPSLLMKPGKPEMTGREDGMAPPAKRGCGAAKYAGAVPIGEGTEDIDSGVVAKQTNARLVASLPEGGREETSTLSRVVVHVDLQWEERTCPANGAVAPRGGAARGRQLKSLVTPSLRTGVVEVGRGYRTGRMVQARSTAGTSAKGVER